MASNIETRLQRLEQSARHRGGKFIIVKANHGAPDHDLGEKIDWESYGVDWDNEQNLVLRIASFFGDADPPTVVSVRDL